MESPIYLIIEISDRYLRDCSLIIPKLDSQMPINTDFGKGEYIVTVSLHNVKCALQLGIFIGEIPSKTLIVSTSIF